MFTLKSSALLATIIASCVLFSHSASALSGSQFKAGRIMDDAVFFNKNSMSASQIQSFLNSKVPVCDTNGTKMYNSTMTRKQYAASRGVSTPFICLKNYKQNTPAKAAESQLCGAISAKSGQTAAQIIYNVGQICGVSPKVLLVLLQKEQSLVTDDWPWPIQYRAATGYACPDTAPCDSQYYGFFNQVYHAARVYKVYKKIDGPNYRAGFTNFIQWHPNASCGGSNVLIENQTTAGLYNYTPYRPNAAALNNLYGTGNSCSSYGNRNFWRMYVDWFGSPHTTASYAWVLESQELYSDAARTKTFTSTPTAQPGGKIYARIKAVNWGNKAWENSFMKIGTSRPNDRTSAFADPTWLSNGRTTQMIESSVAPGQIGTFEFILEAPSQTGSYKEYFNLVAEDRSWLNDIGLYYSMNVVSPASPSTTDYMLTANEKLLPGQYLISQDKQSVLILQNDGNVVLYRNFKPVWNSGTHGRAPKHLIMQPDGNLVLYSPNNQVLWNSQTSDEPDSSRLALQTDSNLVIYTPSNAPVWFTSTTHNPNLLNYVNTKLPVGNLLPGQQLETANRKFRLVFQSDGNVVLYSPNKALWSSRTNGKSASSLSMQPDGNLVIYNTAGKAIWNTRTNGKGAAFLQIQQDGNLVLYKTNGGVMWQTNTDGLE
jgi:hypothetical protein